MDCDRRCVKILPGWVCGRCRPRVRLTFLDNRIGTSRKLLTQLIPYLTRIVRPLWVPPLIFFYSFLLIFLNELVRLSVLFRSCFDIPPSFLSTWWIFNHLIGTVEWNLEGMLGRRNRGPKVKRQMHEELLVLLHMGESHLQSSVRKTEGILREPTKILIMIKRALRTR